jgi:hypothetical protein
MFLFSRRMAVGARLRAMRGLYRSFMGENTPEARGRALMRQWLTPAQRSQFDEHGYFDVGGGSTGKRYRVQYGSSTNVQEIGFDGQPQAGWCFMPQGNLVAGDVMLAQKIALETNELEALAVANLFAPLAGRSRR